jgi:hypothetical protein
MGEKEAELRAIVEAERFDIPELVSLKVATESLKSTMTGIMDSPGWEGASADQAKILFTKLIDNFQKVTTATEMIQQTIHSANSARDRAAESANSLPSGKVDPFWVNAARTASSVVYLGQTLPADLAIGFIQNHLGNEREEAAKAAVAALEADLKYESTNLSKSREILETADSGDVPPPPPPPPLPQPSPQPVGGSDSPARGTNGTGSTPSQGSGGLGGGIDTNWTGPGGDPGITQYPITSNPPTYIGGGGPGTNFNPGPSVDGGLVGGTLPGTAPGGGHGGSTFPGGSNGADGNGGGHGSGGLNGGLGGGGGLGSGLAGGGGGAAALAAAKLGGAGGAGRLGLNGGGGAGSNGANARLGAAGSGGAGGRLGGGGLAGAGGTGGTGGAGAGARLGGGGLLGSSGSGATPGAAGAGGAAATSGGSGARGGGMMGGGGGGGGGGDKEKRSGLGGFMAPKLEDEDDAAPRSTGASAGGRQPKSED